MAEPQVMTEINYEENYRSLSEENKKLSIDIASLQLSNRSLVNQNRDEKKKVMDCRLQISDLEGRLKNLENIKAELAQCQTQSERLRASLHATESKLASTEKRANQAEGLIRIKDSIIEKQRNFSKELEDKVNNLTDENKNLTSKCGNLEMSLNEALNRAEECDRLRDVLNDKTALLDQLAETSEGISASGLAAANDFFKSQEAKLLEQLAELKQSRTTMESSIKTLTSEKEYFRKQNERLENDFEDAKEKCSLLETRLKESGYKDRRSKNDAANARLIGPSLPPWRMEEKKTDPNELEKLANADPATLRTRILEQDEQIHELNQLLTYREDVILRIHEEISKKASRLESVEVERSSLNAQVSILKRELACLRDDAPRRRGGYPPEIEIEIERLRGKRDREYQRRKRAEAEMDEMDQELTALKAKYKALEEAVPPKPIPAPSDPVDKSRIVELQATVSQLRMDNEAKRSEIFDLRSRFDEKSTQLETITSEIKLKDRALADISIELSSKVGQLEYANQELESVRCRVVRGGSETERWQTDLNSVRTTNRFLSSQINELNKKLSITEERLSFYQTKHLNKIEPIEVETNSALLCSSCRHGMCNGLDSKHEITIQKDTDKQAKDALIRIEQLTDDLLKEQNASHTISDRCSSLTKQLVDTEQMLKIARDELTDCKNDCRLNDFEQTVQAATTPSPPAKRGRRTRSRGGSAVKASECSVCGMLKKQVHELEIELDEANTAIKSSVLELNNLRLDIANSLEETCSLRQQLTSIKTEYRSASESVTNCLSTVSRFLSDVDNNVCICSGDLITFEQLKSLPASIKLST